MSYCSMPTWLPCRPLHAKQILTSHLGKACCYVSISFCPRWTVLLSQQSHLAASSRAWEAHRGAAAPVAGRGCQRPHIERRVQVRLVAQDVVRQDTAKRVCHDGHLPLQRKLPHSV